MFEGNLHVDPNMQVVTAEIWFAYRWLEMELDEGQHSV